MENICRTAYNKWCEDGESQLYTTYLWLLKTRGKATGEKNLESREEGPLGHCLRVESRNWSQVGYRGSEENLLVDERTF